MLNPFRINKERKQDFSEQVRKTEEEYFEFVRKRIREAREERGMTQEELGNAIHKSRVIISDLERGRTEVNAADLMRIAHVLEKPIKYFFPIRDVPSEEELTTEEWELVLQFRKLDNYPELRKILINEAKKLAELAQIKDIETIENLLKDAKKKIRKNELRGRSSPPTGIPRRTHRAKRDSFHSQ